MGPLQPLKSILRSRVTNHCSLIKKVRNLSLLIDIQIDLFEKKNLLNQFFYMDVRFGVLGIMT